MDNRARPSLEKPTAGVALELYVRDAQQRQSYYRLERDGVLAWAGGRDAVHRTPTWTGLMQPQEITELLALLEDQQWFQPEQKSTRQPRWQFYELHLEYADDARTRRVSGRWEAIEPVERLLYQAALRRLEPELQALPRPGLVERDQSHSPQPQPEMKDSAPSPP